MVNVVRDTSLIHLLLLVMISGYMVVSMVPTRQSDQNQRLMSAELIDDDGDHDTGILIYY